jgi:hypothetical protein
MAKADVLDQQTNSQDEHVAGEEKRTRRNSTPPRSETPTTNMLPPEPTGTGGQLVRLTVNLTSRSADALDRASKTTGDSKTDTVNRALQVYALFQELVERGGGSLRIVHPDGQIERIHIV